MPPLNLLDKVKDVAVATLKIPVVVAGSAVESDEERDARAGDAERQATPRTPPPTPTPSRPPRRRPSP